MKKDPVVLLTFDVEEFDLPLEYNLRISEEEQMEIGKAGTEEMKRILEVAQIPATLFTTANFAQHYPELIKTLAQKNEIGSHTFYHSSFENKDLQTSLNTLEAITGNKVTGLRMPRFKKIDINLVKEAGYSYDSSVNPTYVPGKYNNLNLPRTLYREKDFLRLPVSVTPVLRFPLFWLSFKNIPYSIYKKIAMNTLLKDGYLSLYFHPWEFTDISKWEIPFYIKRQCGNPLSDNLNRLIADLKKEARFETVTDFIAGYPKSLL